MLKHNLRLKPVASSRRHAEALDAGDDLGLCPGAIGAQDDIGRLLAAAVEDDLRVVRRG